MIDLRMFCLSFIILLQNGPWFAMISICSCCSFWRNIDLSVFQQLLSDKCEFDSIWKQTLLGGSQMSYYTPTCSDSLLTSVLNFQTPITDGWRLRMSLHFCLLCNWLRSICWQYKDFDYFWSLGYKGPITSKTITSCRRNERFQRPKTSWFDFVFLFAFKNKHRFENFFRS